MSIRKFKNGNLLYNMKTTSIKQQIKNTSIEEKAVIFGGTLLVVFFTVKLFKNAFNNTRRNSEIKKFDDVNAHAVKYATNLYSAFFLSSATWLSDFLGDGTDEQLVFSTAQEMFQTKTSFSEVSQSYNKLYNRVLLQDLQKELSTQEMQQFNSLLKRGLGRLKTIRI